MFCQTTLLNKKWQAFTHMCTAHSTFVLMLSLSKELNYLKSVAINRGLNPSTIDKTVKRILQVLLNFYSDPHQNQCSRKTFVLPFYSPVTHTLVTISKHYLSNLLMKSIFLLLNLLFQWIKNMFSAITVN